MPPSKAQMEIEVLRNPARKAIERLLEEVNKVGDNRDQTDARVFERKLRVIEKQARDFDGILSNYDLKWIEARTKELSVNEYAAEYDIMLDYKKQLHQVQAMVETELETLLPDESKDDWKSLLKQLIQPAQAKLLEPEPFESSRVDGNQNLEAILKQLADAEEARACNLPTVQLKKFTGDSANRNIMLQ